MKQFIILTLLIVPLITFGQQTMKDFMEENCDVVWFGLDFTKAKLIGSDGFNDPVEIRDNFFGKWNRLIISEGDKYDWGRALLVSDLKYDYGIVNVVNDKVKVKNLVIDKSYSLKDGDVERAVSQYKINDYEEGIGVVVVVESFDNVKDLGTGYITFFDIGSMKVIYKHKVVGEPGGFGFRNYWARAIYNWTKYTRGRVMKDIKKEFK